LSASLRSREPKLLSREKCERMLDAASFEDCAKLLVESGYPDMSAMNTREIEKALNEHRAQIFNELDRTVPDKEIAAVFKMKYDYHNAKTLIKAEATGADAMLIMSDAGRFAPQMLLDAYTEDKLSFLPEMFASAIKEAKETLAKTANPQLADFVLDKTCYAEMKKTADGLENKFLADYVQLLIDNSNLRTAVRTMRMGKGEDFMRQALIPGGKVDTDRFAVCDKEQLSAAFSHTVLEQAAVLGVQAIDGGAMTAFERECDNALNTFIKGAKLVSFGPETLVAYLAAVESELTAIRMILTGRLAGIAPEVIKERLRELYA